MRPAHPRTMVTWWTLTWAACTPQESVTDVDLGVGPNADGEGDIPSEDADGDGFPAAIDCHDGDPDVWPGAPEHCDGRLTDCDATTEDGLVTIAGLATYTDLQAALDHAIIGDEVRVCPGTWTGAFVAPVPVTLIGQGGREVTILDADGPGPVLSVSPGSTVAGLTLTDGAAPAGGGVLLTAVGELVVADCAVRDNHAEEEGGGIAVPDGSELAVPGTILELNTAAGGGGGIAAGPGTTVDLTGAVIRRNHAAYGGGLMLFDASVTGGQVVENRSDAPLGSPFGGAGVHARGNVTMTGTEIGHNVSAQSGGGIKAETGTRMRLVDVWIHDNEAGGGGGIWIHHGEVVMEGTSRVSANVGYDVGGIFALYSTIAGGEVSYNVTTTNGGGGIDVLYGRVEGVVVRGNSTMRGGGGIAAEGTDVVGCTVEDNVALYDGGGIWTSDAGRVIDTMVARNSAAHGGGMSFYVGNATDVGEVRGCTVVDNTAAYGGGLVAFGGAPGAQLVIAETDLLRNVATERGGALIFPNWGSFLEVTVENCDLGTGADDNVPDDVATGGFREYAGWGAGATFRCTDRDGCNPAP